MKYQIGDKVKLELNPGAPRYELFDRYFRDVEFTIVYYIPGSYTCSCNFDIQGHPKTEIFNCLESELRKI